MKLNYDGKLGSIKFGFYFCHTQLVFPVDYILPWERQIMEMSGVTCNMDAYSTAVKHNIKLCNYRAIDMLLF